MKLVLIGYRGTGKSQVGRFLAGELGVPFLDTDTLVEERAGKRIPEIFAEQGEAGFRELEHAVIRALPPDTCVISTGGGAVLRPDNVALLRKNGTLILLSATVETIVSRIAGSDRPALTGRPVVEEVKTLLAARRDAYSGAADFCIATDGQSVRGTGDRILRLIRNGAVSRDVRSRALGFFRDSGISPEDTNALERALLPGSGPCCTKFFGIAGNPATHSKSPPLFNRLFAHHGIDAFYTRFQGNDIATIVEVAKTMDAKGLSVTIPFKEQVMRCIDEIDPVAREIGAVNTVVFSCGRSVGHNTDWLGIREPLEHRAGARAAVLGAGGAAAAAVYALRDLGMDITILVRNPGKAQAFADRAGCRVAPLDRFSEIRPEVVVNATPVGMAPDTNSPVPVSGLRKGMTVFDLVYTPEETPLLQGARIAGCEAITGTEMFVRQAAAQFRFFTGIAVSPGLVRSMLP